MFRIFDVVGVQPSDSNFYSIGDFLSKKNYWAVSISLEDARINKFYEPKDLSNSPNRDELIEEKVETQEQKLNQRNKVRKLEHLL